MICFLENLTYTTKCGVLQEGGELTWWGVWLWRISGGPVTWDDV